MPSALQVEDLVKRYGNLTAVDRLSFDVAGGSVVALLGPNGAGKTTTVEIAEGFRRADSGQVRVLGHPTGERSIQHRIGVMSQEGGGYPTMRAGDLLRLTAGYYRYPLDPHDLLDCLGLLNVAHVLWAKLSHGQQKRLSLAMAVVGRPDLLFLDEPTAGLDPQARLAAWELLQALRRDGVAIVLTTHDMHEAERLGDDVVILDQGRKVAHGSVTALTGTANQVHFSTSGSLDLDRLKAVLPNGVTATITGLGTTELDGTITPDLLQSLTAWFADQDVECVNLRVGRRSLESVYLSLTGKQLAP